MKSQTRRQGVSPPDGPRSANVFLGASVVWFTLRMIADSNPIWAIVSDCLIEVRYGT